MPKNEIQNVVGSALYKYHFVSDDIDIKEEYTDASEQGALFQFVREYLRHFNDPDKAYTVFVNGNDYVVTFTHSGVSKPVYYQAHIARNGL